MFDLYNEKKFYLNNMAAPFFLGLGMFRLLLFNDLPMRERHCNSKPAYFIIRSMLCFQHDSHIKIYLQLLKTGSLDNAIQEFSLA